MREQPDAKKHQMLGEEIVMKSVFRILVTTALVTPAAAWAQDAAEADAGGLEEIVVTAQKRAESLSDVPISIAAVGGDDIEEKGTANLEQLSSSVPNLRITQTGIANRIAIRGISSGDNKGFEQSAAMFVDGIYFGRDQLVRMPIVDVQRVEVLRGPQPTLFGKNAIAGAISIINRKPEDECTAWRHGGRPACGLLPQAGRLFVQHRARQGRAKG
jgi:iron complex outermembrane receptor protein